MVKKSLSDYIKESGLTPEDRLFIDRDGKPISFKPVVKAPQAENYTKPSIYYPDSLDQLEGRLARCYMCKMTVQSVTACTEGYASYEYMGDGSQIATNNCRCGLYMHVHNEELWAKRPDLTPHEPVASGPREFDTFYCGCRGWD